MTATELYEQDFVAWTERQARELRALRVSRWNGPLDLDHLAEDIEDSGRSQRHACDCLRQHLATNLDAHYQTAARLTTRALACEEPDISPDIPSECPWSLDDIFESDAPLSS